MTLQSPQQGLASPHESVVSKADLIEGVLASLKQGKIPDAAGLYRRSKEDIGYELMNVVMGGELAKPLANVFLDARDYYKAAQVFEKLDMKAEAAQNYEKEGAYGEAAELYASIDDMANSAEMLERGGSYARSAPLFEQAGQWLDAGRNYAKAEESFLAGSAFLQGGDKKKALECLQKVKADDASYPQAATFLGPILEELGFQELALQKYRDATQDEPIGPDNKSTYYRLARMYEANGQLKDAQQVYAKLLESDLTYEDVQDRYRTLKQGKAQTSAAVVADAPKHPPSVVVLNEDRSLFEQSVLFRDLTFDEMRSLLEIAESRSFKSGDLILREGQPFPGLVLVRQGEIAIGMNLGGKDIRLVTFRAGDHLGEMTVQGAHNSRVTAVATTDGNYIVIAADKIGAFLDRNPRLSAKLMKNLMAAMDVHLDQTKQVIKSLWKRAP